MFPWRWTKTLRARASDWNILQYCHADDVGGGGGDGDDVGGVGDDGD